MIFKTREEIELYHKERIKEDPTTSIYFEHYGIRALGSEISYKIDLAKNTIISQMSEMISPTSEIVLLSKLLYQNASIEFQKPFKIKATITADSDIYLPKNQEYSDGMNMFICRNETAYKKDIPMELELELGQVSKIEARVNRFDLYFKIKTEYTYKEIYEIEVYRGSRRLNYSQAFAKENGDYSLEISIDGTIVIVVKTDNKKGNDVKINDILDVYIYTTSESDTLPRSILPLQDSEIYFSFKDIVKIGSYKKFMSISDMQDKLKYNKNSDQSLIYNEDYRSYILRNVTGIEEIKVWQEYDELRENPNVNATNKLFVSYMSLDNINLDNKIIDAIREAVYGKYVVIKQPTIVNIGVEIALLSTGLIPDFIESIIKSSVVGFYDDKLKKLTKGKIYTIIKEAIPKDMDLSVEIVISSKGVFRNTNFFKISEENININIYREQS